MPIARPSLPGVTGLVSPGVAIEQFADHNSLVPGRIDQMQWRLMSPSVAPRFRPIYAVTGSTGKRQWIWVNYDEHCPDGGYVERPFTVPTGVTGVRIELDDVRLPDGVGSSPAFALELYDTTGITEVHSEEFTPTSTSTDVATSTITVTPGSEYRVRVVCNVAGQATFVCGRLRVRPVTTSDSFWEDFARIDADHSIIQDSNEVGWANPRFPLQSPFSHIDMLTNARELRVEVLDNIGDYVADRGKPSVFVNGDPIDPPLDTTIGGIAYCSCTIPAGAGMQHVSVVAGPQAVSGLPDPVEENRGSFICGIYVPQQARVEILPERLDGAAERVVLYGDSKLANFYSSSPGRDGLAFVLRRAGWRVISNSAGGDSLQSSTGSTLSEAACTPLARKLLRKNPTRVVLGIGRNDIAGSQFSAADLLTQLTNLANAIHDISPNCKVVFLTFTHETSATESVYGTDLDTVRDGVRGLPDALGDWCDVVDGAALWSVAEAGDYTYDGVHPNDAGQELIAGGLVGDDLPWSPMQTGTLELWWVGGHGLVGAATGSVTSEGTSPPTVTLTGTPVIACRLRIEVKTAGTLGNSLFRWSIDGGRSWVQQDVPTAASVLLSPLGVTAQFSAGTYPNDAVYTADMTVGEWRDIAGNGIVVTQTIPSRRPRFAPLAPNATGLYFDGNSQRLELASGLNIHQPYSIFAVGKRDTHVTFGAIVGSPAAGACTTIYTNSTTTIAANLSTQIQIEADATQLRCYIVIANGASSLFCVDDTEVSGSLGTSAMTGIYIGGGLNPSAGWWNGYIDEVMVFSGALSSDERAALRARARKKWGTA